MYGVVLLHWTWMVEVWSTLAVSTPCVPKFRVEALLIVQVAAIVIWLVNVVVAKPASATTQLSTHKIATTNARTRLVRSFNMETSPCRGQRLARWFPSGTEILMSSSKGT